MKGGGTVAREERPGLLQLRPLAVGLRGQLQERGVVATRLLAVAQQLGSPRRAVQSAEPVRLRPGRELESLERLSWLAQLEQQLAQQLSRGENRARRDRVL